MVRVFPPASFMNLGPGPNIPLFLIRDYEALEIIHTDVLTRKEAREPRIVEIHWASESGFNAHIHLPALLSACKESRKISFPIHSRTGHFGFFTNSVFWFDPDCDILYFPYPSDCPLSYGFSLASFLRRKFGPFVGCRHLAICVSPVGCSI